MYNTYLLFMTVGLLLPTMPPDTGPSLHRLSPSPMRPIPGR